jgi:hypothetical protein
MLYAPHALEFMTCNSSPVLPTCVYSVVGDTVKAGRPSAGPLDRIQHPLQEALPLGKKCFMKAACILVVPRASGPCFFCRWCFTDRRLGVDNISLRWSPGWFGMSPIGSVSLGSNILGVMPSLTGCSRGAAFMRVFVGCWGAWV